MLLVVVMPLTILAIALFGMWAMGLSFGAALLLGAVLAPTDPVLAGDVGLSGPGGEVYGEPRLSLHTEAGFNDGLASPFVVLGLFVAAEGGTGWLAEWLAADLLYGAGAGLALGAAAGFAAAALLTRARDAVPLSGGARGLRDDRRRARHLRVDRGDRRLRPARRVRCRASRSAATSSTTRCTGRSTTAPRPWARRSSCSCC